MTKIQNSAVVIPSTEESAKGSTYPGYFVQVPIDLLRSNLSSAALRLYLLLLSYCGPKSWAWPSQSRLAEDMLLSERRVRSLMLELEKAGLVLVKHTLGSSNTYQVHKYELKGGVLNDSSNQPSPITDRGITQEENFLVERNYSSAKLHEAESKHVCEESHLKNGGKQTKVTPVSPTNSNNSTSQPTTEISPIDSLICAESQLEFERLFMAGGLSDLVSKELAAIVVKNYRDSSYVKLILEASRKHHIHNPAGFIRFMVLRNAEPTPVKQPGKTTKPARNCSRTETPLDFSKYVTGKYAYLTNPAVQSTLNGQEEPELVHFEEISPPDSLVPLPPDSLTDNDQPTELNRLLPVEAGLQFTAGCLPPIPWSQPAHLKVRRIIAKVYDLEEKKVLADWGKVLEGLPNRSQTTYFYPALGWLADKDGLKCYQVVFRNKFDRRVGERWLPLLLERLKVLYGSEITLICQNLELI